MLDIARYVLAVLALVTFPPALLYWFLIHPLAAYWRKLGPGWTYTILTVVGVLLGVTIFQLRQPLLRVEYGLRPALTWLALACYLASIAVEILCRRHLKLGILAGVPEISGQRYPGKLLTEGIYGRVRHPRLSAKDNKMSRMRLKMIACSSIILGACWLPGCTGNDTTLRENPDSAQEREEQAADGAGGAPISSRIPENFRRLQEDLLAEARAELAENPDDPDALIWVGRRLGYLGRYEEALEIYSQGVEQHPENPKILRHRGHRYISTRRLGLAVADLERASQLVVGQPDEIEPDGLPNARGIPTSTIQSNIWYHLGLAYYLGGELEEALRAYRECLDVSTNPDMLSATSHWLYMTLRRIGQKEEAEEVLEPIHAEMDIIENRDYHRLLLMYKGEIPPERLLEEARIEGGIGPATVGYGVGNWYLYNSMGERAQELFREVVSGEQRSAFGFIAAEAELSRLPSGVQPASTGVETNL